MNAHRAMLQSSICVLPDDCNWCLTHPCSLTQTQIAANALQANQISRGMHASTGNTFAVGLCPSTSIALRAR